MTIRTNAELNTILMGCTTQYEQVRALDTALTTNKRIKAKRHANASATQDEVWNTGTLFRDAALIGACTIVNNAITKYGVTSDLITHLAADLATGKSVLRIEGGGHWVEGTLGLPGSGADFIFPVNPTASNSIAIAGTMRLRPSSWLPVGNPDEIAPTISLSPQSTTVTSAGPFLLTANATDNTGVVKVEFFRDGSLIGTKLAAPWTYSDTLAYANIGTRVYTAKAYDAAGNAATSAPQSVVVNITAPVESGTEIAIGAEFTTVSFTNTSASVQNAMPVTFGHIFKVGQLPASGANVELVTATSTVVPCQIDVRAYHGDGSVRHAVISAILPSMNASETKVMSLRRKAAGSAPTPAVPADFADATAVASITEGGVTYTASLADLLAVSYTTWLAGDIVSEWEVAAPLKTSGGVNHPRIHARFCLRAYKGQSKARVDICLENTWAFESDADVTYDVLLTVGGNMVYSKTGLVHHALARWRKLYWWNTSEPAVHIAHNIDYLIASKAIPNYDRSVVPDTASGTTWKNNTITNGEPMGRGTARANMEDTGGRMDIGLLPGWAALYLIGMHKDAKEATLNQGNLAGSWGAHMRDKNTGRVICFDDYPYYSNKGTAADTTNPATGLSEKAPTLTTTNANRSDVAHHPDQAYIPYLVTGDLYYLEELQFWAQACPISVNPHATYRDTKKGLLFSMQVRAQAWGLRSLAHAAYISPPGPLKNGFEFMLKSNIDWYDARYTNNAADDAKLGALIHTGAIVYPSTTGSQNGIAQWQDDHFTSAVGRMIELGYTYALPLLVWKSKFQVGRLYGTPGFCWIQAAAMSLRVRDTNTSAIYTTLKECFDKSFSPEIIAAAANSNCGTQEMATAWGNYNTWRTTVSPTRAFQDGVSNPIAGDMDGYSDVQHGYPSNLQPAIAYCATNGTPNAANAWDVFMGRTVKPNYGLGPQFAILPRT